MSYCYLCSTEAKISAGDYGRRKSVWCPSCGYYEVSNSAIPKLEDDGMPPTVRADLVKVIQRINSSNKDAEIVFNASVLSAREKQDI